MPHPKVDPALAVLAAQLGLSPETLKDAIAQGKIRAMTTISPAPQTNTPTPPRREDFEHLRGQGITISQAAEKYNLPGTTVRNWVRLNYVSVLDDSAYPKQIDEATMAYCDAVRQYRETINPGGFGSVPLLDVNGEPIYELRFADQARYRRQKKTGQLSGGAIRAPHAMIAKSAPARTRK